MPPGIEFLLIWAWERRMNPIWYKFLWFTASVLSVMFLFVHPFRPDSGSSLRDGRQQHRQFPLPETLTCDVHILFALKHILVDSLFHIKNKEENGKMGKKTRKHFILYVSTYLCSRDDLQNECLIFNLEYSHPCRRPFTFLLCVSCSVHLFIHASVLLSSDFADFIRVCSERVW